MRSIAFAMLLAACPANDELPAPRLISIVPDRGVPGVVVTVTGSDLCQIAHEEDDEGTPLVCPDSDGAIYFGSFLGTALSSWEDTMLMIEVPESPPGEVDLRVQVKGKTTNSLDFVVE